MRSLLLTTILLLAAAHCYGPPCLTFYGKNQAAASSPTANAAVYLLSSAGVLNGSSSGATEGQTAVTWVNQVPTSAGDLTLGTATFHTNGPGGQPYLSLTNSPWLTRAQNTGPSDYIINLPYTVFAVTRTWSVDTSSFAAFFVDGLDCLVGWWPPGAPTGFRATLNTTVLGNFTVSTGQWHEITVVVTNSYAALRLDGAELGHNSSADVDFFDWERIGVPSFATWSGDFAAVIVLSTNLTPTALGTYETNLMNTYAIPH